MTINSGNAQVFSVPIVYQDLRPQETFFQICDALQNLSNVVDGVFTTIKTRVEGEKQRIANISSRLAVAQAKVTHISMNYQTRATTVLSPNKYPGTEMMKDYIPLYIDLQPAPPTRSKFTEVLKPNVCFYFFLFFYIFLLFSCFFR